MVDYKEDNKWTVYLHTVPKEITNYTHDKFYVGITKQKPEKRWQNHYKGQIFHNAINYYGWDNIKHEIVATNLSQEEAKLMEQQLIAELQSNTREFGYNRTAGGDTAGNIPTIFVNQYTLEGIYIKTWDSITEAQCYYNLSNHIVDCCKGRRRSIGGFQWRYYEGNTDNIEPYIPWEKPIIAYTLNGEFFKIWDMASEAEKELGITKSNICLCCQGKYSHAQNYIFKYFNGCTDDIEPIKEYYNTIPVAQIKNEEIIKIWDNVFVLRKEKNYRPAHIKNCCFGKYKQMYGFQWKFKKDINIEERNGSFLLLKINKRKDVYK